MPKLQITNPEHRRAKERQAWYKEQGLNKSLKYCYAEIVNEAEMRNNMNKLLGTPNKRQRETSYFGLGLR